MESNQLQQLVILFLTLLFANASYFGYDDSSMKDFQTIMQILNKPRKPERNMVSTSASIR